MLKKDEEMLKGLMKGRASLDSDMILSDLKLECQEMNQSLYHKEGSKLRETETASMTSIDERYHLPSDDDEAQQDEELFRLRQLANKKKSKMFIQENKSNFSLVNNILVS